MRATNDARNCAFSERQAIIVTDSLVWPLDGDESEPAGHATKALALPDRRLVVVGMGSAAVTTTWQAHLLARGIAGDVESLDSIAPDILHKLWQSAGRDCSTSIVHFGVTARDEVVGFRYSREDGFRSERLEPWRGYYAPTPRLPELQQQEDSQPASPTANAEPENPAASVDAKPMRPHWLELVRTLTTAVPFQRWHRVGGRLQFTSITPDGIRQHWKGMVEDIDEAEHMLSPCRAAL